MITIAVARKNLIPKEKRQSNDITYNLTFFNQRYIVHIYTKHDSGWDESVTDEKSLKGHF